VNVSASQIFQYLEQHRALSIMRHEVECRPFMALRRAMYGLIVGLRDEDSGDTDLSDRLRQSLSEWLTVPTPFAQLRAPVLDELRDADLVGQRWGEEMRRCFEDAQHSLRALRINTSPLRSQLGEQIRNADAASIRWRIYCHRSAAEHFVSCSSEVGCEIDADRFIHSLRDYRRTAPFDLLIKVGPLRSRGWGTFPNGCVNAPRYQELVQIVWSGMSDEPGFGTDPIVALFSPATGNGRESDSPEENQLGDGAARGLSWKRTVVSHTDGDTKQESPEITVHPALDELATFSKMGSIHAPRRAVLLHFGSGFGVLYPPNADVLLLNPGVTTSDALIRIPLAEAGELRGRFLIRADVGDVNLGAHLTEHGWYSNHWKAELKRQYQHHAEGLLRNLRGTGITLRNLRGCVEHWMHPASSVIHAPQQRKHFEMLIDVLEMESRAPRPNIRRRAVPWSQGAWQEIATSRGQAIQFGMQEQEIIGEEVDRIVFALLPEVLASAQTAEMFRVAIPVGHALEGSISFFLIYEIEAGFCVSESLLKTLMPVSGAEEWRA
jgi:hypothetical protein